MSNFEIKDNKIMKQVNVKHRLNCKFSEVKLILKLLDERVECCDPNYITYEEISNQLKELINFIDSDTYERIYIEGKRD